MTANAADPTTDHAIVLIHGLWITPISWEHWIDRYTGRGHRVLAPACPAWRATSRNCAATHLRSRGTVKGMVDLPLSTLRATRLVLGNPFNRNKAIGRAPKQSHYAFTNTLARSDYTVGQEGWEEVADYAFDWATSHATRSAIRDGGGN